MGMIRRISLREYHFRLWNKHRQGSTTYALYTDNNANGRYTSSTDSIRETAVLDNNFKVSDIKPCGPADTCGTLSSLSVNFIPPDPGVLITNSSGTSYDAATIVLGITGTSTPVRWSLTVQV